MIKWVTLLLVLIYQIGFAQSDIKNYPDSTDFWINRNYLNCMKLGNDVCVSLSKNEFVMLYFDYENKKVLIHSSIYFFGLETSAYLDMSSADNSKSNYTIAKQWPLSDSLILNVTGNTLTVDYKNEKIFFYKQRLKTLDIPKTPQGIFTYETEICKQNDVLNSWSLLAFPYTDKSHQLFSIEELKSLIENNKVTIGCSDDFNYNSMLIEQDTVRYFHLVYSQNKVTIYELPKGRDRYEKIELNGLIRQEFYKEK